MGLKPPLKRALFLSVTVFQFIENTFHFSGRADAVSKEVGAFYPAGLDDNIHPCAQRVGQSQKALYFCLGPLERCQNNHQAKQCEESSRLWEYLNGQRQGVKHHRRISVCKGGNAAWGQGRGRVEGAPFFRETNNTTGRAKPAQSTCKSQSKCHLSQKTCKCSQESP